MNTNGKSEFKEGFVSDRVDPLHVSHQDFDLDEIDRLLSGKNEAEIEDRADFVTGVFKFVTDVPFIGSKTEQLVGRRFLALAWVLSPANFDGSPSATKLAGILGLGDPKMFLRLTGAASRKFGIRNRSQSRGWNNGITKAPSKPATLLQHATDPNTATENEIAPSDNQEGTAP